MTPTPRNALTRSRFIRFAAAVAAWAIAVASTVVGLSFVIAGTVVVWRDMGDQTSVSESVDVRFAGIGLLCVGILCLVALLIVTAFAPATTSAMIPAPGVREEDA